MSEDKKREHKTKQTIQSVENHTFEPIRGYPMLHWKGKRPFSSTQYYPAQLKETHGEEVHGWMNKIFWGDNIQVMSHLLKEFRGQIDLIYIDPPFDSKADYKKKIKLKWITVRNDRSSFEEKQYTDIWTNDEYLQFIYERLILMRELLADTGTIYVHCDWHKVHYLKLIMDEIFGAQNFRNEIIWCYTGASNVSKDFPKKHDNILRYSKTKNYFFNKEAIRIPYAEGSLDRAKRNVIASGGMNFSEIKLNENGKVVEDFWEDIVNVSDLRNDIKDTYDWWKDIQRAARYPNETVGYPTQKPIKLLERIIKGSSKPGDIVFDCFMGSGTTQTVAMKLGRKFIGADINLGAIQTSTKRLLYNASTFDKGACTETKYTGFQVYNVNHYDIFRNPLEAKDVLMKALEIQPVPGNSLYDGEKDGAMVKIMPINRIATKADLNELITNFDYKKFELLSSKNPNKPVESILLVCMGHEPDLSVEFQKAIPFPLQIEVVDILRDKANIEFKRDLDAAMIIEDGKVLIQEFYPMNLLQKLSSHKENVDNWKELTDSIMIDFKYNGRSFKPTEIDIPKSTEQVKGVYPIPKHAGTIRVKITDLLGESIEVTLEAKDH